MYITRCPHCQTAFKLNDAQLDAHQGKVRCGQCRRVFNAAERLLAVTDLSGNTQRIVFGDDDEATASTPEQAAPAKIFSSDDPKPPAKSVFYPPVADTPTDAPAPPITFDFTVNKKKAEWKGWRWVLVCAALALLGQAAWHSRTTLWLNWPHARPTIERISHTLGQPWQTPKRLDKLQLQNQQVNFNERQQLEIIAEIHNQADFAQTPPILEVTLSNALGKVLVTQTFSAKDYNPDAKNVPAQGLTPIRLRLNAPYPEASRFDLALSYD